MSQVRTAIGPKKTPSVTPQQVQFQEIDSIVTQTIRQASSTSNVISSTTSTSVVTAIGPKRKPQTDVTSTSATTLTLPVHSTSSHTSYPPVEIETLALPPPSKVTTFLKPSVKQNAHNVEPTAILPPLQSSTTVLQVEPPLKSNETRSVIESTVELSLPKPVEQLIHKQVEAPTVEVAKSTVVAPKPTAVASKPVEAPKSTAVASKSNVVAPKPTVEAPKSTGVIPKSTAVAPKSTVEVSKPSSVPANVKNANIQPTNIEPPRKSSGSTSNAGLKSNTELPRKSSGSTSSNMEPPRRSSGHKSNMEPPRKSSGPKSNIELPRKSSTSSKPSEIEVVLPDTITFELDDPKFNMKDLLKDVTIIVEDKSDPHEIAPEDIEVIVDNKEKLEVKGDLVLPKAEDIKFEQTAEIPSYTVYLGGPGITSGTIGKPAPIFIKIVDSATKKAGEIQLDRLKLNFRGPSIVPNPEYHKFGDGLYYVIYKPKMPGTYTAFMMVDGHMVLKAQKVNWLAAGSEKPKPDDKVEISRTIKPQIIKPDKVEVKPQPTKPEELKIDKIEILHTIKPQDIKIGKMEVLKIDKSETKPEDVKYEFVVEFDPNISLEQPSQAHLLPSLQKTRPKRKARAPVANPVHVKQEMEKKSRDASLEVNKQVEQSATRKYVPPGAGRGMMGMAALAGAAMQARSKQLGKESTTQSEKEEPAQEKNKEETIMPSRPMGFGNLDVGTLKSNLKKAVSVPPKFTSDDSKTNQKSNTNINVPKPNNAPSPRSKIERTMSESQKKREEDQHRARKAAFIAQHAGSQKKTKSELEKIIQVEITKIQAATELEMQEIALTDEAFAKFSEEAEKAGKALSIVVREEQLQAATDKKLADAHKRTIVARKKIEEERRIIKEIQLKSKECRQKIEQINKKIKTEKDKIRQLQLTKH